MRDFTVSLADLRRVTGLGDFASRSILAKPTPLPFVKAKPGPRGGNSQRIYLLRPLLLRLRLEGWCTSSIEQELCRMDLAARTNEVFSK